MTPTTPTHPTLTNADHIDEAMCEGWSVLVRGHARMIEEKALVFYGPGSKSWDEVPNPEIRDNTDAIVRVECTTICGSDLHILKGDVPEVTKGRILGHEAVGTVESVGSAGSAVTTVTNRDQRRCGRHSGAGPPSRGR
jgi:hypothetical protein